MHAIQGIFQLPAILWLNNPKNELIPRRLALLGMFFDVVHDAGDLFAQYIFFVESRLIAAVIGVAGRHDLRTWEWLETCILVLQSR